MRLMRAIRNTTVPGGACSADSPHPRPSTPPNLAPSVPLAYRRVVGGMGKGNVGEGGPWLGKIPTNLAPQSPSPTHAPSSHGHAGTVGLSHR